MIETSNTQINFKIHSNKKSDRFNIYQPTKLNIFQICKLLTIMVATFKAVQYFYSCLLFYFQRIVVKITCQLSTFNLLI